MERRISGRDREGERVGGKERERQRELGIEMEVGKGGRGRERRPTDRLVRGKSEMGVWGERERETENSNRRTRTGRKKSGQAGRERR